ncbi:MAG: IS6 family transposase, partial [Bradyrhizobium sp.]
AKKVVLSRVIHRQSRYLNNRAENSHQPTRQRERRRKRFKSPQHAQRFCETHDVIAPHFRPKRHRLSAKQYRAEREGRFETWREITASASSF